jgi:nitroreductase
MAGAKCDSQYYAQLDIGIITANLTLAATSKSISTCIVGSFHEKGLKELFAIPEDVKIRLVLAVGYAKSDEIRNKSRKEFDEIAGFNGWN